MFSCLCKVTDLAVCLCLWECAFKCVHVFLQSFVCMCVSETEIQPASWTSPLSSSCIIPPRAQDSALSLRVTHGEAAPCPWRTEGITALSLSVTPALSPVMPPRWQVEGGGGTPITNGDRLTGDRWSQPDRKCHRHSNLHTYPSVVVCVNVCKHTNTYSCFVKHHWDVITRSFWGWNDSLWDLLYDFLNCKGINLNVRNGKKKRKEKKSRYSGKILIIMNTACPQLCPVVSLLTSQCCQNCTGWRNLLWLTSSPSPNKPGCIFYLYRHLCSYSFNC